MNAIICLEDGRHFAGKSFGAEGEAVGEVVFNTSMMGYQEILTDPSYQGQIVLMTYPLIGNYGINYEDVESRRIFLSGFIVKEYCFYPSNFRSETSLGEFLKKADIVGIEGIDTRALTRHIRDKGAQQGIISTLDFDVESLIKKIKKSPGLIGRDFVKEVTTNSPYSWNEGGWDLEKGYRKNSTKKPQRYKVVAYDFGIKHNILRMLVDSGCDVEVVPANTRAEDVLARNPDGVFLSNGPGDPEAVSYAINSTKRLLGKKPIFGICLGHQILGLALGGKTYKLKFGHHGANHPVKELSSGRIEITAQNHGFAVDVDSISDAYLTHVNLNDQTVEGMAHKNLPVFSVQYHPEASPGPHDSRYLFKRFVDLMEKYRNS
ncbi:MAG: carbamoyl phosphate synthase small subunit [Candidatus Schekmanbacteria bacterium RIFCSPHIGHO2_02_FULL_38_11]|uniref:Carbamoyl phosphate synthase small chain n=1 Tax=Candidatus Schekmanbacteria bacterium RIFCSPLOWO2_12_FULL_38_15 TaxID=1817883 RepID=A0A1F7SKN4_9BACT|nr:MAG: carbamoyl phosphate synthase small subunit [Candidatus Schekmanbacteria bacterium RIFCSPLOWO2_02_FULL_38_14]OGL49174.1 MAG: carbamoyl phosphate synthase small subunit [Candidatus Schekmanbacteria bacterium RIFCSPHIGHO2_02_FULL_38_11]OGL54325.1 MAG: carbamoyl phosphate synthase small subunit [Candidatus Schekmanbacteria bacterium RIFCSPLOWO2_12_FULL_38_15]